MSSVVLDLEHDALNPAIDLSDLLRKAMLVSRKLGVKEFQEWTEKELNGYGSKQDLPDYRKLSGSSQCLDSYHGWIPIRFDQFNSDRYWTTWTCAEPISQIIATIQSKTGSDFVQVSYSAEVSKALLDSIGRTTQVRLVVGIASLISLLDAVRTIVLNWALKLEEDKILGEGMTFTLQEKSIAQSAIYNVTNFFSTVGLSQIQQQTSNSSQSLVSEKIDIEPIIKFLDEIKENLPKLQLNSEMKQELNAEVDTIDAQTSSPKPKDSILRESLSSIRRILEGTGGAIAAELLIRLAQLYTG